MLDKLETTLNTYVKHHPISLIFLGPLLGLIFVMFLPALGFILFGYTLIMKLGSWISLSRTRKPINLRN